MKSQLDLVAHHQMERFRVEENQNGNHHQRCTWIAQALTTKHQKQRENLQELLKTKQTVLDLEDRSCPKLRDHLAKKKVIPSQNEWMDASVNDILVLKILVTPEGWEEIMLNNDRYSKWVLKAYGNDQGLNCLQEWAGHAYVIIVPFNLILSINISWRYKSFEWVF